MQNKGFRYSFTLPELGFFLFGKKKCPQCGCKLVKKKDFEIRTDLFYKEGDSIFHPDSEVKVYSYSYHCEKCDFQSTLSDLARKK